jgi:hypothetical protein
LNKRWIIILVSLVSVFTVGVVGASVLNLNGSDSAPGESKTEAACASNLVVKHPVETSGPDENKITTVNITGDLSMCIDQTIRVDVNLDVSNSHVYAIKKITADDVAGITFTIDATTGDFYDQKPTPLDGGLVPAGSLADALTVKDFGMTTITIARAWE